MMRLYSQRDEQWRFRKIGASSLTVGSFGCTLSCVAMLSSAFGEVGVTPAEIVAHEDWFTKPGDPQGEGLILWHKLGVRGLRFVWRKRAFDENLAKAVIASKDKAVMFEVDMGKSRHWVIGVRRLLMGGWRVADPLCGAYIDLPRTWRPIGMAVFQKI